MAKTQKEIDDLKKEYTSLKTKLDVLSEDELKQVVGGVSNYLPDGYIEVSICGICDNYESSPNLPSFTHGKCDGCIYREHMQHGWYYFYACKHAKNYRSQ